MLDRASSFARDDVIGMLNSDYVPVALDVWYEERRKDAVGAFYHRIVAQRDGLVAGQTTQGFYIARSDGTLVRGWNNRDPDKLARFLRDARTSTAQPGEGPQESTPVDARFVRTPPDGGAIVEVFAKITNAAWATEPRGWMDAAMRGAIGRDHLWVTRDEIKALADGAFPPTLARRIARFHLIDNTRGEPPMWDAGEVRDLEVGLTPAGDGAWTASGTVRIASDDGARRCDAVLRADLAVDDGRLSRFDLVAECAFAGEGRYTPHAPPGTFTLVIATRLATGGAADAVPPQAARDLGDYLRAR